MDCFAQIDTTFVVDDMVLVRGRCIGFAILSCCCLHPIQEMSLLIFLPQFGMKDALGRLDLNDSSVYELSCSHFGILFESYHNIFKVSLRIDLSLNFMLSLILQFHIYEVGYALFDLIEYERDKMLIAFSYAFTHLTLKGKHYH